MKWVIPEGAMRQGTGWWRASNGEIFKIDLEATHYFNEDLTGRLAYRQYQIWTRTGVTSVVEMCPLEVALLCSSNL